MRRSWIWLALLALAAGCDEKSTRQANAPQPDLTMPERRAAAKVFADPETQSSSDMKDAVAAPVSNASPVNFDKGKTPPETSASASTQFIAPPVAQPRLPEPSAAGASPDAVAACAAGKPRIVYLGDSLSTRYFGLGPAMYQALVSAHPEANVEMYAYGGSSPLWFLPKFRRVGMGNSYTPGAPDAGATAPKIDELLKAGGVAAVIVEQGTNMIDWTSLKNGKPGGVWGVSDAAELAKRIADSGAKCLWIGPPDMNGYKGSDKAMVLKAIQSADEKISAAVSPACVYIKSSDKTRYSGADGIHQNAKTGEAWAAKLLADPALKL